MRLAVHSPGWRAIGSLAALVMTIACGHPVDRPLEGAPPSGAGQASGNLVDPPPTVSVPEAIRQGGSAPLVAAAPSPSPSPALAARNPILSGLVPAPDARLPAGSVDIGARVAASAELTEVVLLVDGAAVRPQITPQNPLIWLVAYSGKLDAGTHEVRLTAKDRDGRAGGYRWQFEVELPAEPTSTPRPAHRT